MKSQFKKADASGARFALIFGADELAQGMVALKPLRGEGTAPGAAAAGRRCGLGARVARRIIHRLIAARSARPTSNFTIAHDGHPPRPARAGASRRAEGVLAAVRQPDHLGAGRRAAGLSRHATAGTGGSASRPPRPARCSTSSIARRTPAMPRRRARVFGDLKERYPRTAYAQQGGLLAAKLQFDKGKADDARATLAWVIEHAVEDEYRTLARLRLAGVLLDAKQYDEALKQLDAVPEARSLRWPPTAAATCCWRKARRPKREPPTRRAHKLMDDKVEYRRLIEAKLTALGARAGRAGGRGLRGVTMTLRGIRSLAASVTVAAALLLAACAAEKPKPTPLEPIESKLSRARRSGAAARRREVSAHGAGARWPVRGGRQRRHRAGARCGQRPAASGAPTPARRSRPASAATAASPRWSRATTNWWCSKPATSAGAND